jgi:hypothetical protein
VDLILNLKCHKLANDFLQTFCEPWVGEVIQKLYSQDSKISNFPCFRWDSYLSNNNNVRKKTHSHITLINERFWAEFLKLIIHQILSPPQVLYTN